MIRTLQEEAARKKPRKRNQKKRISIDLGPQAEENKSETKKIKRSRENQGKTRKAKRRIKNEPTKSVTKT